MSDIDWDAAPPAAPPGYRTNARGDLIREANIPEIDLDMDRVVRRIHDFGAALSAEMWRYRAHTLDDIYAYLDRVVEQYHAAQRRAGARRGNVTLTSYDGLRRVVLAQAEVIDVGPEIHAAQAIIEECIDDWASRSRLELRALVEGAFRPDATGRLSVSALLRLRRIQIDDDRWREARLAISDALRPVGRAEYVRLYRRDDPARPWEAVPLHLAQVRRPEGADVDARAQLARRVASAIDQAERSGLPPSEIWGVVRSAIPRRRPAPAPEPAPEPEPAP